MVVSLQKLLDRSNKNMKKGTHKVVRSKALEMVKIAYNKGIYVQISEGYRSNERQQQLYNQGRTSPGKIVTNAKPGQSIHNYGKAVDFFLVSDDGSKALWTVNRKWRKVAEIGKSLGFEWGGDWTSFKDYPHLQMKEITNRSSNTKVGGKRMLEKLSVDGIRGNKTIRRWQQFLGTPKDGVISRPSTMIKSWQEFLNSYAGVRLKVDGYEGKKTIKAGQKFFGTPKDGKISNVSPLIKELQKFLNEYGR